MSLEEGWNYKGHERVEWWSYSLFVTQSCRMYDEELEVKRAYVLHISRGIVLPVLRPTRGLCNFMKAVV